MQKDKHIRQEIDEICLAFERAIGVLYKKIDEITELKSKLETIKETINAKEKTAKPARKRNIQTSDNGEKPKRYNK